MRVLLYRHESSAGHDNGPGHPERPARIQAVAAGVERSTADVADRVPPEATTEQLTRIHRPDYVRSIEAFCRAGGGALDADTRAVAASWPAALRAAGAGPAAVAELREGGADAAFLALRPPGHHALPSRAMGFCLFNNIAVTAAGLLAAGERVAIVDWDVHHGNGTQDVFYDRLDLLYLSFHEFPAYPGTGWLDEDGYGHADGTTLNLPFPSGTAGDVYREATERVIMPVLEAFAPDWVLVSAGYDAHAADPLAGIRLEAADYRFLSGRVQRAAPPGRLIYFLEGGYNLAAIEASVAATLSEGEAEPGRLRSPAQAYRTLELVVSQAARHWEVS